MIGWQSIPRNRKTLVSLLCLCIAVAWPIAAFAAPEENDSDSALASIRWQNGPCTAQLGTVASIEIPEGYRFADAKDTATLMEMMQNPSDESELGCVFKDGSDWFVVFDFADIGYVKDDEASNLDADAILKSVRQGTEATNKERKRRGWATMQIEGWEIRPQYNTETHNLEWAIRGSSEGETVLNYNTRLLGRHGVMSANLVIDPDDLARTLPTYKTLLEGFSFNPGGRYSEFRKGDKVAQYGLTALITGGAAAVAIKTGLLQKAWKFIAIGVVAVIAAARGAFRKLLGRDE